MKHVFIFIFGMLVGSCMVTGSAITDAVLIEIHRDVIEDHPRA